MVNVGLLLKTSRSLKIPWLVNRKRKADLFLVLLKICYTVKLTSLLSMLSFLILEVLCFCFCQWSSKDETGPEIRDLGS